MARQFILPVLLGFALYLYIQQFGHQDQVLALYAQYLSPLILTISDTRLGQVSELVSQYTQSQKLQGEPETSKPFTRHIVAVGDLHGDFSNALKVLQFSGVVDDYGNWTGNADFFVQTGDIIDRGDDTIKLFTWMDKLREQATATGGIVLTHLGNHEWMNAIGDWRYVYPTELKTFGTVGARQKMLSTGRIGRSWAANYTVASRLPLHL
ncbi:hypothetical protein MPER_06582, partial [Moniliophthora perniciosa FA553]